MLLLFTIGLIIFQFACFFIPVINKKNELDSAEPKYTVWDKSLIAISFVSFIFSIIVYVMTDNKADADENLQKKYRTDLMNGLAARDSIHQTRDSIQAHNFAISLDSSYTKSIRASNEALAKYNLILIDSLGTVSQKINLKSINKPQLTLVPNATGETPPMYGSKENNNTFLNIKFLSENNTSYNINVYYYVFKCSNSDTFIISFPVLDSGILIRNRSFFTTNRVSTTKFLIKPEWLDQGNYFILMIGNYSSDSQNKYIIKYEEAVTFDFKTQNARMVLGVDLKAIKKKSKLRR